MGIFAIVGLSAAPIFFGFLMEPWLPLGHWGWGLALFFALLPSAIYWRKKIFSRVRNIGQRAKKKPLKTAAEEITGDGKEVAKPIKKSGPNWTMPELIQHMYNAGNDLSRCIDEIHDKARLEQLSMWGRKYSAASPHENPNPLRPIPATSLGPLLSGHAASVPMRRTRPHPALSLGLRVSGSTITTAPSKTCE